MGGGQQSFFLALTLVVMLVIVLTAKNLTTAVVLIGLIANFLIISTQLVLLGDRHLLRTAGGRAAASSVMVTPPPSLLAGASRFGDGPREPFSGVTTAPPGKAPPRAFPLVQRAAGGRGPEAPEEAGGGDGYEDYPGAIDFGAGGAAAAWSDQGPRWGHSDWDAAARDGVPEGNPFSRNRVAAPAAAPPCADDDALAIHDADELNAYQARARNDPDRVRAGALRRKAFVSHYVKEELDEQEDSQWWGRHEV